jgi:hypothetical protein
MIAGFRLPQEWTLLFVDLILSNSASTGLSRLVADDFPCGLAPVQAGGGHFLPDDHRTALFTAETHLVRENLDIRPAAGAFKNFDVKVSTFRTGTAAIQGSTPSCSYFGVLIAGHSIYRADVYDMSIDAI